MKKRFSWCLAVIGIAAIAFAFTAVAPSKSSLVLPAYAAESGCGTQTLHGAYIYSADGYVMTAPGQFTPIAEAGVYTFDGAGNLSTTNTISFGGQIIPRTTTGTYSVNSECTGTVNVTGGVTFDFAVTRSGGEMRLVVSSPSVSVTGSMIRQ